MITNMHLAKTHFSKLIAAVMRGEEVIIAKSGKPTAKIIPFSEDTPKRQFGVLKGKINIADDFDASLPNKILKSFEE